MRLSLLFLIDSCTTSVIVLCSLVIHCNIAIGCGTGATGLCPLIRKVLDCNLGKGEAFTTSYVLVRVLNVESTALPDHVQVLARVQHFLLVLCQEDWHHFFTVSEPLLPVSVVEVGLNVFFLAILIFFDNELFEGVLEDTTENPLLENLEVWQRGLLEQEGEEVPDRRVRAADHQFVNHVEEGTAFFVSRIHRQSLQVVHDANTVLEVEPDLLQRQVRLHELSVELGHQKKVLFEKDPDSSAEGVTHETKIKLGMNVDELLDVVVVAAEWQHFVDQEL